MIRSLVNLAKREAFYKNLELQDRKAGKQLQLVSDNRDRIKTGAILLFVCLRNEKFRMPFFADYYRSLGVDHFFVVDNDSDDGFQEWAAGQTDMTVWYTNASYKASNFGMLWLNDLLRRYGSGHWCVVVDPDEFLVYPYMETRKLRALTSFLEEERRPCMHAVMLDAYSDGPMYDAVLAEGASPFDTCQFFDRDGYIQSEGWGGGVWIRGGPRLRLHFRENPDTAPALNKIPLIKWHPRYHYRMSMHDARPFKLNKAHAQGTISPTGALFHFKFVAQLQSKAEEELGRREHYSGGQEYIAYAKVGDTVMYDPGISERFTNSEALARLGLISPGKWF